MGTLQRYFGKLGWLGAFAALLVVAAAVLAAVESFVGGGVLLAVAIAVVALAPRALKWIDEVRKEEKGLLRIKKPISRVEPFEGRLVFNSALAEQDYESGDPPYIPRDVDATLREALKARHFVLLTGTSKSGKSRTAFEAARSMDPEPTLLVPGSPDTLPKLLELGLPVDRSEPSVLWLDDLDRYLQGPGVSRASLEGLGKPESRVVVLATITLTTYERLRSSEGEIGRSAREIMDLFEEVYLPNDNSPAELEEARRLYPSQDFVAGIGEHFAAARELIARFRIALEAHRHGFAVVVAALDWRRAGMSRPIMEEELRELYTPCLGHFHPLLEPNDEGYKSGLAWARAPLQSRAALLMPAEVEGAKGFRIFDYVRDWVDSAGSDVDPGLREVLGSTWTFVIGRAGPTEAAAIGFEAYARGEFDSAEGAWRKAVDSGDPDASPVAAFDLGVLLKERGRLQEAEESYRWAIASEHQDQAPSAARNLGLLLQEQGRPEEAEEAFRMAIASEDQDAAPSAARNLGLLLKERGRPEEAEWAFRIVVASEHQDQAPSAAVNLGSLLEERGRPEEAEEAFRMAIASEHQDAAPKAAVNLGSLLEEQGRFREARVAFEKAISSGHADAAPVAALTLGLLLEERGHHKEAEEAFKLAVDSGHRDLAPKALLSLGMLFEERGRPREAEETYKQAIGSGHPGGAPRAAFSLGMMLEGQGRFWEAGGAYRQAIDSEHPDLAPAAAAFALGMLLQGQDRLREAEEAYRLAIDSGTTGEFVRAAEEALRRLRIQGGS